MVGQLANEVRSFIETEIERMGEKLEELLEKERLRKNRCYHTGTRKSLAKASITTVLDEIKDIFIGIGFQIAEGPEIEEGVL